MNRHIKILFSISFVILFIFVLTRSVHAATLYFSPSSGSYEVAKTFSVSIYVSSADQAMNAVSGVISFPRDKLEVTSLSKTGSIFSLWVQEPSFSNSAGTVNFEGIVLNPGFTGGSGKAVTIIFRTKTAGDAQLTFSSGSALANDGKGTNILTDMKDANFLITAPKPEIPKIIIPVEVAGTLPEAPEINSLTHPNSNNWYALKDAKFTWELSPGITGARLLMGRISNAVPTVTYIPAISSKELDNLEDGIWYFSVRLRNNAGWGAISRFRFQIDTRPPEPFSIKFIDGNKTDNPRPTALFDATDSLSGIDYYKIKIGEGDFFPLLSNEDVKSNPYTLPLQAPGKRNILVQAFDKAGNYTVATEEFVIEALEPPIITEWPRELQSSEQLIVKGASKYPNAQIVVWLQKEGEDAKSQSTKSDEKGNFVFVADEKLSDGAHKLWAKVVDERGAGSKTSDRVIIVVGRPTFLKLGSWAVSLLAVIIPLVALVFILFFIIWYGWHKFVSFRKKLKNLRKEVREAELALHKAFDMLKEDVSEQVKLLEKTRTKRQLTEEEEKIIKQLRKDLDDAERFVRKEIEDIEKAVK